MKIPVDTCLAAFANEEFRPDITLLINSMPLIFVEVKNSNNTDGILAKLKRIQTCFSNKKFRKFINITKLSTLY